MRRLRYAGMDTQPLPQAQPEARAAGSWSGYIFFWLIALVIFSIPVWMWLYQTGRLLRFMPYDLRQRVELKMRTRAGPDRGIPERRLLLPRPWPVRGPDSEKTARSERSVGYVKRERGIKAVLTKEDEEK